MNRFIYWTPRLLSILFILFLGLFSLDVFDPENNYSFAETLIALLIHNIPSFVLLIILLFSWRREIIGGICFILGGLIYIGFILRNIFETGFEWYYLAWSLQISGIAFFIGILFLIGWKIRTKSRRGKK